MGGGLLLSVLFARILGPESFGKFSYVLSFVALFGPLFALGMSKILLREFGKSPSQIDNIIQTCFRSRLLSGILITLVTAVVLYFLQGASWKFQLITLLLIANISNAFEVYGLWFQHQSDNKSVVLWRLSNFIVFALVKGVTLWWGQEWLGQDLLWLIGVVALEILTRNIGFRVLYRFHQKTVVKGVFQFERFRHIFDQSKYLIFSALAAVVYLKIDILMLEGFVGSHGVSSDEVGVYAVAAKLSAVWYVLPQVVMTALFPKLLEIARDQPGRYKALLQQGFDLLFISALCLSLLIYALTPWVIDILFGQSYHGAIEVLRLHIFACVFIFMRALLSQWLVSESFAEFSLFSQLSGAVSNVLLNLWLIPLYGAWGAALATLISYAVTTYFCLWCFKRTHHIAWMMTRAMIFPLRLRSVFRRG